MRSIGLREAPVRPFARGARTPSSTLAPARTATYARTIPARQCPGRPSLMSIQQLRMPVTATTAAAAT
jgi:hypothetical protein